MSEQRHEWKVNGVPWEVSRIGGGKLIVTAGDLQWADHMTLPVVLEELTRLSAALAVAEGERDEALRVIRLVGRGNAAKVSAEHSPCLLCGYNGRNWWQKGSHEDGCPVRELGGFKAREDFWKDRLAERIVAEERTKEGENGQS